MTDRRKTASVERAAWVAPEAARWRRQSAWATRVASKSSFPGHGSNGGSSAAWYDEALLRHGVPALLRSRVLRYGLLNIASSARSSFTQYTVDHFNGCGSVGHIQASFVSSASRSGPPKSGQADRCGVKPKESYFFRIPLRAWDFGLLLDLLRPLGIVHGERRNAVDPSAHSLMRASEKRCGARGVRDTYCFGADVRTSPSATAGIYETNDKFPERGPEVPI